MRTWIVPFVLLFSVPALAGVIAGHPCDVVFSGGTGLSISGAYIDVSDVIYYECDDTPHTFEVDDRLELGTDTLGIPVGTWCGVDIVLSGPYHIWGTGLSGGTYSITLDAGTISIPLDSLVVNQDYSSDADLFRIADPSWITASSLGLGPNVNVVIDHYSTQHAALRDHVLYDSAVLL